MKKLIFILITFISMSDLIAQNIGIGTTTPNASAILEISSSNKGLLLPRLTDTSSVASPAKGLMIYNNTNNKLWYYDGARWQQAVANGGGMDSIWFRTRDTVVYTAKPYVGINSDYSVIEPQANLQVNGSLLVQAKMTYSNSSPTLPQTYTMNNTGSTQNIGSSDSVMRLYDPGGIANYNNNMQGNVFMAGPSTSSYKVSSAAADFGIAAGDTLWISQQSYPGCKSEYVYRFTNTSANPADFILPGYYYYFIFRSNGDNINGPGFNFTIRRLYNAEPVKTINNAGPSLYFNSGTGAFVAGISSYATAESIALGSNAYATNRSAAIGYNVRATNESFALGFSTTASGESSLAMGRYTNATARYSTAMGYSTDATGEQSVAMGDGADAFGQTSFAFGFSTLANDYTSVAMGHFSESRSFAAMALGSSCIASGYASAAIGRGVESRGYGGVAVGQYNDPILASPQNTNGSGTSTTPVFIVGNGTGVGSLSNAMAILRNGNVGIGTNTPALKLEVYGSDAIINDVTIGMGGGALNSNTAVGNLSLSVNTTGAANTAMGYHALQDNTTADYNSAFGYVALANNTTGASNTAIGYRSLFSNTTGYSNVAIGARSLYLNTFRNNLVAIGDSALYNNDGGRYNTAIGSKALYANTSGQGNTATGYNVLQDNTGGNYNTGNGNGALVSNTSGSDNTSIGATTLIMNTTGDDNTAVGSGSMYYNTTGSSNTVMGRYALFCKTASTGNTVIGASALTTCGSGNNNTVLGYLSDVSGAFNSSTALGYTSAATASNQVRIGNTSTSSIGGYANWTNVSDGRIKKNIQENVPGLAFINLLVPVTYNLNLDAAQKITERQPVYDKNGKLLNATPTSFDLQSQKEKETIVQSGFIAQDVEKAALSIGYNFSGVDAAKNEKDLYGLRYAEFVVPLVKAVQELSRQNEELKKQNDDLKTRLEKLEIIISKK